MRPSNQILNIARVTLGQIRPDLATPRVRRQMCLKLLAAFGVSTAALLLKNGATKGDIAELVRSGLIESNRLRFRLDPRADGATITALELTKKGRKLAKASGAADWRPARANYHQVSHDLLVQSLAIELGRIIGPVPGRIRSIVSASAILNRPEAQRTKMLGGAVTRHVPDAVVPTRAGPIFVEVERTAKKALEKFRFIRKLIDLSEHGRVIVSIPSLQTARKFYDELAAAARHGWLDESYYYCAATQVWHKRCNDLIEPGENDWPEGLCPRYLDVGLFDNLGWADLRRQQRGVWVLAGWRTLEHRIPFMALDAWLKWRPNME